MKIYNIAARTFQSWTNESTPRLIPSDKLAEYSTMTLRRADVRSIEFSAKTKRDAQAQLNRFTDTMSRNLSIEILECGFIVFT